MKINPINQNINSTSRFSLLSLKEQQPRKKYINEQNKQPLARDVHYIQMMFYQKKFFWAHQMNALTYDVSMMISNKENFNDILSLIEKQMSVVNPNKKSNYTFGKRRQTPFRQYTMGEMFRGAEYYSRYLWKLDENGKFQPKSNEEYKNANVCKMDRAYTFDLKDKLIDIDFKYDEFKNIELAHNEYDKLMSLKNPSIQDINKSSATIKWLFCQETPYERGTDSISNILIKGIYHANNVKISPLKKKCSLDFEAFDTDLDEYIKRFPLFFTQKPEKI